MSPVGDGDVTLYARYRRLSLGMKILIFMTLGAALGIVAGPRATVLRPLGDLFIRMLVMGVVPLVFFNLLAGITRLPDLKTLGRVGGRILVYYFATTVLALALGLGVVLALRPGDGMPLSEPVSRDVGTVPSVVDVLLQLVPDNIFAAFAAGDVAQVVVFAIFLGVATLFLPAEPRDTLRAGYATLADLLRKLIDIVMWFGPLGLGALAASAVGEYGAAIFGPLAMFQIGVWLAQLVMVAVYLALLAIFADVSPGRFLYDTGPLYATTAATCSSLASLAVAMEVAEERVKLPRSIYAFTLPLGAQLNKDGTAVLLTAVLVFTAQAAGVSLGAAALATAVLIGVVLTAGSGGIPGGGLIIALVFVQAFHLPLEIAAIIGGVYRLIDMGNTTINCMGDMVGTVIVAHGEGWTQERAA